MNSEVLKIRIETLEEEVKSLKEAAINPVLSEGIVQHIASQIQTLFRNPVMLSGITSAILQNLQNSLVFRAGHSKERQAQLIVNEQYVPGSQRISLSGTGVISLCTQMMPEGVDPAEVTDGEWVEHKFEDGDMAEKALTQLIQSYNVDEDVPRYLITDIDLQAYRENLTHQITAQAENSARESALAKAAV
jgi:hypothetical protein